MSKLTPIVYLKREETSKWRDLVWASEKILPLLTIEEYRSLLLEGALIATVCFDLDSLSLELVYSFYVRT